MDRVESLGYVLSAHVRCLETVPDATPDGTWYIFVIII